ncbi:MAG: ankyrin repeat domain-containing protein [Acidobacteriota bacterium]
MSGLDLAAVVAGKGSLWLLSALLVYRWLGPRTGAAQRHLWLGAALVGFLALPLAKSVLPPVDLAWLPASESAERSAAPWTPASAAALESSAAVAAPTSSPAGDGSLGAGSRRTADLAAAAAGVWALVSASLLLRFLWSHIQLRRLIAGATTFAVADAELASALDASSARLLTHADVSSPWTCGFVRPAVLLPPTASSWTAREMRDVVVHELAHVDRKDWFTGQVARVVCALFFFQPLTWLVTACLAREAELACDDRVLRSGASAPDYAERLLQFARVARTPPAALAMARSSDLSQRITALLDPDLRRNAMTRFTFGLILCVTATLLLAVAPSTLVHAGDDAPAVADPARAPLWAAADRGDLTEVRALIASGSDVNLGVRGEGTPLIRAAFHGHLAVVEALLDAGADASLAETDGPRTIPRTPLAAASVSGDQDIIRLLLEAGADAGDTPRRDASALMVAAGQGHLNVVEMLLDGGADADRVIRGDGTPLIHAAAGGHAEVVARLLSDGADPNRVVKGDGSPLIQAAKKGSLETVQLLLTAGADPNLEVRGDGTPLIAAANGGHRAVIDALLAAGADPNGVSRGDGSPLIGAAQRGDVEATERLLTAGAKPDRFVVGDGSPLIRAAAAGQVETTKLLIDRGASLELVAVGDENALIQASANGQLETVEALVLRGADVNSSVEAELSGGGTETRTPLLMARRGGHQEVVKFLETHGARD